jgi:hypothetical protein
MRFALRSRHRPPFPACRITGPSGNCTNAAGAYARLKPESKPELKAEQSQHKAFQSH